MGTLKYEIDENTSPGKYFRAYTKRDLSTTKGVLYDFGFKKGTLVVPEEVKTYGQLMRWKNTLINEILAS